MRLAELTIRDNERDMRGMREVTGGDGERETEIETERKGEREREGDK